MTEYKEKLEKYEESLNLCEKRNSYSLTETTTLIPFMERIKKGCGHTYKNVIADTGYASEKILEQQISDGKPQLRLRK